MDFTFYSIILILPTIPAKFWYQLNYPIYRLFLNSLIVLHYKSCCLQILSCTLVDLCQSYNSLEAYQLQLKPIGLEHVCSFLTHVARIVSIQSGVFWELTRPSWKKPCFFSSERVYSLSFRFNCRGQYRKECQPGVVWFCTLLGSWFCLGLLPWCSLFFLACLWRYFYVPCVLWCTFSKGFSHIFFI